MEGWRDMEGFNMSDYIIQHVGAHFIFTLLRLPFPLFSLRFYGVNNGIKTFTDA